MNETNYLLFIFLETFKNVIFSMKSLEIFQHLMADLQKCVTDSKLP